MVVNTMGRFTMLVSRSTWGLMSQCDVDFLSMTQSADEECALASGMSVVQGSLCQHRPYVKGLGAWIGSSDKRVRGFFGMGQTHEEAVFDRGW